MISLKRDSYKYSLELHFNILSHMIYFGNQPSAYSYAYELFPQYL